MNIIRFICIKQFVGFVSKHTVLQYFERTIQAINNDSGYISLFIYKHEFINTIHNKHFISNKHYE